MGAPYIYDISHLRVKVISKFLAIDFHMFAFRGTAHIQSTTPPSSLNKMGKYRLSEVRERQLKFSS